MFPTRRGILVRRLLDVIATIVTSAISSRDTSYKWRKEKYKSSSFPKSLKKVAFHVQVYLSYRFNLICFRS